MAKRDDYYSEYPEKIWPTMESPCTFLGAVTPELLKRIRERRAALTTQYTPSLRPEQGGDG